MELDEVLEVQSLYQNHKIRRDLLLAALVCGTELSAFDRGSASLYHHSPNVAGAKPFTISANPYWRGHYSWSHIDLILYRLEGL